MNKLWILEIKYIEYIVWGIKIRIYWGIHPDLAWNTAKIKISKGERCWRTKTKNKTEEVPSSQQSHTGKLLTNATPSIIRRFFPHGVPIGGGGEEKDPKHEKRYIKILHTQGSQWPIYLPSQSSEEALVAKFYNLKVWSERGKH